MNNIKKILCLAFGVILLASCTPNEQPSNSSSLEVQTTWTNEDLDAINEVIGDTNTLPFFPLLVELNYEEASIDYSCNHLRVQAESVRNEDEFNGYVDICLAEEFVDTETTNDDFRYYKLFEKDVTTTSTSTTTQYILYYDDELYLTIETYLITTYTAQAFPSDPSISSLLETDANIPSFSGISEATYYRYTSDYTYHVALNAALTNAFDYKDILESANYILDFDRTTAFEYCYYLIHTYEIDSEQYQECIEIYIPKIAENNQVEITYTIVY